MLQAPVLFGIIFPLQREMRVKPSVAFSDAFECPGVGSFNINNVTIESNTAGRKTVMLASGCKITAYQVFRFNSASTIS